VSVQEDEGTPFDIDRRNIVVDQNATDATNDFTRAE
jgi:hypothetical protein